jgi:glycosyltransferase involved in cell wall biosynthesis
VLEANELKLLHELGHEVFSPGAYLNPSNGGGEMRPPLPEIVYNPDIVQKWMIHDSIHPAVDGKSYLTKEIVDYFDCVIVMHIPEWIVGNWEAIKHKRVIWRTIGQSLASTEQRLEPFRRAGLEIVRYSPNEIYIPCFIGQNALIRFYQDPDEFGNWNGEKEQVITFCQDMERRGPACNYQLFEEVTRPFPRKLFGPGNDQPGFGMGKVPYEQLKQEMRDNRVYFYTGTHPASYTLNFIESWMTGVPLVAISGKHGNAEVWRNHNLYEIPTLIKNGVNGFISDNPAELKSHIQNLLNNKDLADSISKAGRAEAIRHFGKDMIKEAWKAYLGD